MAMTGKKWPRYFAILVALVMVVETIAFTMTGYAKNDTNTAYELTDEDRTTISEISNMTGVKADELIRLRKEGRTWNQILELIKNNPGYRAEGDDAKRNDMLTRTGMDEAVLNKLKEEGFTEEQIVEAKSLVERVVFQLDEIASMQLVTPSVPDTTANAEVTKKADVTTYTGLAEKINLSEAVYLILKLHDGLGSIQGALDEYLCSLQLEIDLNLYLTDKEGYLLQKQQKLAEMVSREIITVAGIEEKMLDLLQNMNKKDESIPEVKANIPSLPDQTKESPLPEVEVPAVKDIKPQNPAEAVLQEIEGLVDNVGGQKGE